MHNGHKDVTGSYFIKADDSLHNGVCFFWEGLFKLGIVNEVINENCMQFAIRAHR